MEILDGFSHNQHIVSAHCLFVDYLGFVLNRGNSLAWITPHTVKICSSVLLSSPCFMILHNAGLVNCYILLESQNLCWSIAAGQMLIVALYEVSLYAVYIC